MTSSARTIIIASLALSPIFASAKGNQYNGHYTYNQCELMADTTLVEQAFVDNAPAEFSAEPPHIIASSRNGKFIFAVGGYVKASVSYDFGHPVDNSYAFPTSEIPLDINPGDKGKIQFSAQTSTIYTSFILNPGKKQTGAFIGFNFNGDNYLPELIYAYIRHRGFQAGFDYTLFSDPDAAPPTIDYQGPNSYLAIPSVGLRYTHSFGNKQQWKAGAAIELPQASISQSPLTSNISQRVPDIPAFIRFAYDDDASWIRLAAILRNFCYHDLQTDQNRFATGYGAAISGAKECGALTFLWQAAVGKGISSYFQDIEDCGLDLLPDPDKPGHLFAPLSWGAYAALQYNFTENLFCSASYSHLRIYPKGGESLVADPDALTPYSYGQYASANIFYNINSHLQLGLEYIYGLRATPQGERVHNNRIQTALQFSF